MLCRKPYGGGNQLAENMLVDGDGEGEHDIALITQQIFVKALNHQIHDHDADTDEFRSGKQES